MGGVGRRRVTRRRVKKEILGEVGSDAAWCREGKRVEAWIGQERDLNRVVLCSGMRWKGARGVGLL